MGVENSNSLKTKLLIKKDCFRALNQFHIGFNPINSSSPTCEPKLTLHHLETYHYLSWKMLQKEGWRLPTSLPFQKLISMMSHCYWKLNWNCTLTLVSYDCLSADKNSLLLKITVRNFLLIPRKQVEQQLVSTTKAAFKLGSKPTLCI